MAKKYPAQESYAKKMKAKGCIRIMLWVPKEYANSFKKLAQDKINDRSSGK